MIGQHMGESVRPLLMHGVARAQHHLDSAVANRRCQPASRSHVAVVQLAGDERGWDGDLRQLVPERRHTSGAHSAQRGCKARDGVPHALGAQLCDKRRAAPLEAREQRQAAPVVDESPHAIGFDALRQRFVSTAAE